MAALLSGHCDASAGAAARSRCHGKLHLATGERQCSKRHITVGIAV